MYLMYLGSIAHQNWYLYIYMYVYIETFSWVAALIWDDQRNSGNSMSKVMTLIATWFVTWFTFYQFYLPLLSFSYLFLGVHVAPLEIPFCLHFLLHLELHNSISFVARFLAAISSFRKLPKFNLRLSGAISFYLFCTNLILPLQVSLVSVA